MACQRRDSRKIKFDYHTGDPWQEWQIILISKCICRMWGFCEGRHALIIGQYWKGINPISALKGALTENYVYTELQSMGIDTYFWRSNANAELDFCY